MAALPEKDRVALTGVSATLPYPLYAAWFNEYAGVAPVRINYRSEGSPAGVQALVNGTADFGAYARAFGSRSWMRLASIRTPSPPSPGCLLRRAG